MKKHIQEVHEQIKPYQCPYCEKKCSRKPQVVQHVQAKHKIKITEEDIIQMKEIIEVADKDKDWVQQTNIVNGDNFIEENLDEKEERYNCTLCEASFIAKSSLGSHHSVVHDFEGDKSQECPICSIKFSAYGKLQIHLNTVHEGKKPWNCLECDYATTKRYNLKSHIESVHQGIKKEKKWKCSDCDYASAKRFDLKKHTIAVHQG